MSEREILKVSGGDVVLSLMQDGEMVYVTTLIGDVSITMTPKTFLDLFGSMTDQLRKQMAAMGRA